MPGAFADTSGLASIVDRTEEFHELARSHFELVKKEKRRFVTSNYILTELVATLTRPLRTPRTRLIAIMDDLKSSELFEIVHIDTSVDEEAYTLLKSRQDKLWSLVDCSSFVLMTRLGLTEALTTDQHFEQAGFIRLLK